MRMGTEDRDERIPEYGARRTVGGVRRVVIGGLPYFGRMLAGLLSGDGWDVRYLPSAGLRPHAWAASAAQLARADLVYLVGGQIERWSRPDWLLRFGRHPVVMHWVGSDVTHALAVAERGRLSARLVRRPVHWAEAPWTAEELRPLGIEADVVPLAPARLPEAAPLPADFTVLSYLAEPRPDFYGRAAVLDLARALPEAHVLIAGSEGRGWEAPANVEFLGWQREMAPIYVRSSVLVRLPMHDGLSFMVLEALAAGRHVIWNHPLVGVLEAPDARAAGHQLGVLLEAHRAGSLRQNEVGAAFVRQHHAPVQIRSQILSRFQALIAQSGPPGRDPIGA
jgi:glycosyltransferase involved in cell wall biosynthesis